MKKVFTCEGKKCGRKIVVYFGEDDVQDGILKTSVVCSMCDHSHENLEVGVPTAVAKKTVGNGVIFVYSKLY